MRLWAKVLMLVSMMRNSHLILGGVKCEENHWLVESGTISIPGVFLFVSWFD